jgi:integrase
MGIRRRRGHWHYRFVFNGEEQSGNTGLVDTERNRKRAEEIAAAKLDELKQGSAPPPSFEDAAAEFIAWCVDVGYRNKPNTSARIKTSFSSCLEFFRGVLVQDIDAGRLERYRSMRVQEHGVRDITVRHDLHALSVFFKYAMKMKWAASNPVRELKMPSDAESQREHVLEDDEEAKYFATAYEVQDRAGRRNLYDVMKLILNQGCRPEEVMALRKDAVDLEAARMYVRGGKSRAAKRALDLTAESIAILEARLKSPGPWVFPSERHEGRHITKLSNSHDRACIAAGVSFVPYDLRHTFATRQIAAGNDVPTVAALMGHSGLRTIYRYVHPTAEAKKQAMAKYEAAQTRRKLKVVG